MNTKIKAFNGDITYAVPSSPVEFMEFWEQKIAIVPDAYLSTTRIELEVCEMYGDGQLELVISYTRPENEMEQQARVERKERHAGRTKTREIELLRQLQAKYGDVKESEK